MLSVAAARRRADTDLESLIAELEARFDEREGAVKAFVAEPGRFARLRHQATALARRWPDPGKRPTLFGVPLGVKDIFHAAGLPTRAGSRLPAELLAGREAAAVSALLDAGALLVGKTVTTEFAYFAPGPTENPHRPGYTPGGSSSGSAAAVAAGLAALALGTQTIGSISRPAAYCGVVGFKPSSGRIPSAGVIPLAPSLDHVGTFTADAASATTAAAVLVDGWRPHRYAAVRHHKALPVLAIPGGPYLERATRQGRDHFGATCERLEQAGYALETVPVFAELEAIEERHQRLTAGEAARVHAGWFGEHAARYRQPTAELIARGQQVAESQLDRDRAGREALRRELTAAMDDHRIDLWISPAAPGPAPPGLDSTGPPVMNLPWTHAGLPTVALPSGTCPDGLPLGLQVAARFGDDEGLLAEALRLESALA